MGVKFREQVVRLVRCVPPGKLVTYGQVARALGRPRAGRAVGTFMAHLDPTDLSTPWQRVVNRHGGISPRSDLFSELDPVEEQARRLAEENVLPGLDGTYDLKEYGLSDRSLEELGRRSME